MNVQTKPRRCGRCIIIEVSSAWTMSLRATSASSRCESGASFSAAA